MPRSGLTPDRVTAAAADLVDEVGGGALTLAALARRLDVAAPSLYGHVRGNDDLRQRVALLALAELADRAAEAVAGRSGRAALAALGEAYAGYAAAHPGRWALLAQPLGDLDADTARTSAGPRHAALARAALRAYDLPEPDETHAVRFLGATLRGWTDLAAAGAYDHGVALVGPGEPAPPDAAATWERVVDGLDGVFASWSR